jgi:hypothetical protein
MSITRPRLGLSFEVAPPASAHPLRTDIACFVGMLARRRVRAPADMQPMPAVLVRWLASHRVDRVGGVPVGQLRVSLASASAFVDSVVVQGSTDVIILPSGGTTTERLTLAAFLAAQTGGTKSQPLFASLVKACRTMTPVPDALIDDLKQRGFQPGGFLGPDELAAWLRIQRLHNLPVAVESFDTFDALFAWNLRGVRDRIVRDDDPVVVTPTGVAVRAFFGEGGRRCYVIRTGDPSDVFDTRVGRFAACFPQQRVSDPTVFDDDKDRCPQLPGVQRGVEQGEMKGLVGNGQPPALSASDWVGLEHVYGLNDVSFAVLPDLIDACARPVPSNVPPAEVVAAPENFVECVAEAAPESLPVGRRLPPPRLDTIGLKLWRLLQLRALALMNNAGRAFHRRDVQLLASLPLLSDATELPPPSKWIAWMASTPGWLAGSADGADALLSDRLQLAYPWIRTGDSPDAQGGVEAPEGTLAGVLARSALERGSYRSAATRDLHRYQDSEPVMAWTQATQQAVWTPLGSLTLAERVCLLGPTPRGPQLLSDVSCSDDPRTRQASVRRLINVVVQASRDAGNDLAFEPNGEALWAKVRERLSDLMRVLLTAGALSTDGKPFSVRCGRDTMQQNDIDAGRLIAQIEILPAQPIQRIVVVLNLRDAGPASAFANAA